MFSNRQSPVPTQYRRNSRLSVAANIGFNAEPAADAYKSIITYAKPLLFVDDVCCLLLLTCFFLQ
jgi:hypothetical protein